MNLPMLARLSKRAGLAAIVLALVLVFAIPLKASASSAPTVGLGPVCVNDLGVALNGGVNWQGLQPGTITLDWGDGSPPQTGSSVFPLAHTYNSAGLHMISASASDAAGSASTTLSVTVGSGVATCSYSIVPQSLANGVFVSPGQQVTLTVMVTQGGQPLSNAPVWLWFLQAHRGGSASACCYAGGITTLQPLTQTPQVFVTGVNQPAGQVQVTYLAPSVLPRAGMDGIIAQNAPTNPTVIVTSDIGFVSHGNASSSLTEVCQGVTPSITDLIAHDALVHLTLARLAILFGLPEDAFGLAAGYATLFEILFQGQQVCVYEA